MENSLRCKMKDEIRTFLLKSCNHDDRTLVASEDMINEMAVDLADVVFAVLDISEDLQDGPCVDWATWLRGRKILAWAFERGGWLPTPENINALPEGVREYVHDLEAATCSELVQDNAFLRETIKGLEIRVGKGGDNAD